MQLATRRLETPGISLVQAGAEVGHESEAAFNRAFKKIVGTPPGSWRRERFLTAHPTASPTFQPAHIIEGQEPPGPMA